MGEMICCKYRISATSLEAAQALARGVAVEQTVEVPEGLITPTIERDSVGQVRSVEKLDDDRTAYLAQIDYHAEQAAGQLPQLLNLIYGNSSINPAIKLLDCQFPESVLARFAGPRYGVEGLRKMLGVYDRPLVCGVLKPRGRSDDAFAGMVEEFALGGGDLIKDDHNLVHDSFDAFTNRVNKCQAAAEAVSDVTGRGCLYLPYVSASLEELPRFLEFALECGVRGILIGPTVMGLEVVRWVAAQYPLFVMSHPTLTGPMYLNVTNGMQMSFYMGTLMRLLGVDASIFTTFGGRFHLTRAACVETAECLRQPMGALRTSWATPAGGMKFERIGELCDAYGADTILLVGGALHEKRASLEVGTRDFMDAVGEHFSERLETPKL